MAYRKQGGILTVSGLDVSKPSEYISPENTPNCQNIRVYRNVLKKREGTSVLGGALGEYVMGGKYLIRTGVGYNVRVGPTKVELYNTGTFAWDAITGTALTATNTDTVDFAMPLLSGQRILCITNGIDAIRKYTGTGNTAALGGTPPVCKYITEYKDYMVVAYVTTGGSTYTTRVQWCDTSNPENWSTGNSGSKDLNDDNEDITAIKTFGEYVSVHKRSSIYLGYLVSTSSVFRFDKKAVGAGTIAFTTIQNLPGGLQAYLAVDGIRLFNGVSSELIPSQMNDEIRETLNFQYVKYSWSLVVPELDEYWVGVPIGSSQVGDTVYKFNYKTGATHKDKRTNIISAWNYVNSVVLSWNDIASTWDSYSERWDANASGVSTFTPLFGDTSGYTTVRSVIVNNDNTVAIDGFWESKDFESDEKGRLARWMQAEIWALGNAVTVDYSTDGGLTWNSPKTFTLASDYPSDDDPLIYYFDVVSSKLRLRFRNNTLGETFSLKQFVISYVNREARK